MTKNEILEYFKDINHAYNDCTRYDTLKSMINELQELCGDAISRQAVLDMLEDINAETEGVGFYYKHYVEYIKKLPPVKPNYTDAEIQKMQDLESAEIQKAYEIGKAENPNKWIPVSERYPEDGQNILFSTKTGCVFEGRYSADTSAHNWLSYKDDTYAWNNVVTAWMPLPEPYKASPTDEEVEE
jgi:hypothetical protein